MRKARFVVWKNRCIFANQSNETVKLNISRFMQNNNNFTQDFNVFLRRNKAGILCLMLVISSMNFAKAGVENSIPMSDETKQIFGMTNEALVEINSCFEEFILVRKPTIEAYNQDDTTSQTAEQWLAKGETAYEDNDYEEAIKYFEKAIDLNPNLADAYFYRGYCYIAYEEDYDKAAECFKKMIKLDTNNAAAYIALGILYTEYKKDYDKAIKYYEKAVELEPDYIDAYHSLARAYQYGKEDYDKAIKYYEKTVELNPVFEDVYFNLGIIYEESKQDYGKAAEYYKKTIDLDPNYVYVYFRLAKCYVMQGNKKEARKWLKKASKLGVETVQDWYDEIEELLDGNNKK